MASNRPVAPADYDGDFLETEQGGEKSLGREKSFEPSYPLGLELKESK
jgi:hypothetical protein